MVVKKKGKTMKKELKIDKKDKEIIGSVDFGKVKSAINSNDLQELSKIYDLFIRFDTQISAEIDTRRKKIAALPFLLSCENKTQREFLQTYLNSGDFRLLLFALTSAIPYGFSVFLKNFINQDGKILPDYEFIDHSYFKNKNSRLCYEKMGEAQYLDETENTFTYLHASDTGDFVRSALMYKVVCIAALKMAVINQNMNYFENLAVPPIVLQTDKANSDDEKSLEEAINTLLGLRSNSIGVIGKDDILQLLSGNTDKESFLNFIRYCDESISKVISGEVLSANATQKGTQALGSVHAEQKKITTEFDALTLAGGVKVILRHILELNFGSVSEFEFSFDTNTETEEEKQIAVFKGLYDIGVEVPIEHLENAFKISGLTRRDINAQVLETNEPLTKSSQLKFADDIDKSIAKHSFKGELKDIETFLNSILKECDTYEEAYERICENSGDFEFNELENALANAIANANLKGLANAD